MKVGRSVVATFFLIPIRLPDGFVLGRLLSAHNSVRTRQDTKGRDREGPRDEDEGADEKEEPNSYRPPLLPGLFCSIQGGVSNISPHTRIHTSGVLFHLLLFMYLLLPSSIQTPTHHMSCYRILSIYRSFLLLLYLLCVISANHP